MRISALAKINLHLRVGALQATGFHPLVSWMCAVGLFDSLTFDEAQDSALTCDDAALACDQTNLVARAMTVMRREALLAGKTLPQVAVHLAKRIPSGAGLGGGSSDAAATLMALNEIWRLDWPLAKLIGLAAELGSDVPFFLHGPSSICRGRGERVEPIDRPTPLAALLILPDIALPTPAVYRKFDALRLGTDLSDEPDWQQWAALSAGLLLARLVNDLEAPAFALCPPLARLRSEAEQKIGQIVRMSGSGSSLFSLFDQLPAAQAAADSIAQRLAVRALAVPLAQR